MSVTFITGASSGIGAALARLFAADGHTVIISARRAEALEALAAEIAAAGGTAVPMPLDVSDGAAVQATVARIEAEHGPVDLLIANAGISDATPAKRWNTGRMMKTFSVNVFGASHCIEAVLPAMLARGEGHIVGVSSLAAFRGLPGSASYSASKAALSTLLEGMRIELAGKGITVTTLHPGFIKTPMTDEARFPMPFLMELDDAARLMHKAIRAKRRTYAFPWQLARLVKAGRHLPDALYDRAFGTSRRKG